MNAYPDIEKPFEKEEKHIKNAWIAGLIIAVITFIFSLFGAYDESIRHTYGLDTWSLLDVALIAGLTYGIYRKNRYCALGLLIYFVGSKFIMAASSGQFTGGFMSLVFGFFLLQGTRAAFKIHKHKKAVEVPNEERKKGTVFYLSVSLGSVLTLAIVFLLVIGFMSPETEVLPGKQVNKKYLNFVLAEGLIDPTEDIEFWYSDGFGDFKAGFYFFTDKKVVIYSKDWEEPAMIIPFSEVADMDLEHEPSSMVDSRINLYLFDDTSVFFPVSSEYGGDRKFYARLNKLWKSYAKNEDEY